MSHETGHDARQRAAKLMREYGLNPEHWTLRVWENLGWHWELHRGPLRLTFREWAVGSKDVDVWSCESKPEGDRVFHCGLSQAAGTTMQFFGHGKTPHEAIGESMEVATRNLEAMTSACAAIVAAAQEVAP